MRQRILRYIKEFDLLPTNEHVIVAVSGGADSMSLIDFVNFVKYNKKITPIVAHVNHLLRDEESKRDENFVMSYCKEKNIEFECKKVDVKNISKDQKISVEDAARRARYNFFLKLSKKYGGAKILTAHTLSDNVETFLMNLTRGSGPKGLCSIPLKRENIIRPFLFLKKEEILKYCKTYKVSFVNDSSNFSYDYTRNKVRLDIIPRFKQINPSFEDCVSAAVKTIKEDSDFLNKIAKKEFKNSKINDGFLIKNLEKPIATRLIIMSVKEIFSVCLNSRQINQILNILKKGNGVCYLGGKNKLLVENNVLKKFKETKTEKWQMPFKNKDFLTPNNKRIIINTLDCSGKKDSSFLLDSSKVLNSVFRNRRKKDIFLKSRRGVTKSLKKFFNEEKIPASKRQDILLLARGSEILWVEGFGVSESASLSASSKEALEITIKGK